MPQRSVIIIYALIAPMTSIKGPAVGDVVRDGRRDCAVLLWLGGGVLGCQGLAEWCWRDQLPAICPQGRVAYQ